MGKLDVRLAKITSKVTDKKIIGTIQFKLNEISSVRIKVKEIYEEPEGDFLFVKFYVPKSNMYDTCMYDRSNDVFFDFPSSPWPPVGEKGYSHNYQPLSVISLEDVTDLKGLSSKKRYKTLNLVLTSIPSNVIVNSNSPISLMFSTSENIMSYFDTDYPEYYSFNLKMNLACPYNYLSTNKKYIDKIMQVTKRYFDSLFGECYISSKKSKQYAQDPNSKYLLTIKSKPINLEHFSRNQKRIKTELENLTLKIQFWANRGKTK